MSRWFRWYEGTTEDAKFRVVARLSRVTVRDVIALWAFILEDAGHLDHRGVCKRNEDFMAATLDFEDGVVGRILGSMAATDMISVENGAITVCNFRKRQFDGDSSVERVKRHRAKRAAQGLTAQWAAPKDLRIAVYTRDDFQCVYCGSEENLSLDHRTPEIRGGDHSIENLQTLCRSCNGAKRDLTHDEYVTRNTRNGVVTLPERPQSTETEAKTEKKETRASALCVSDDWPKDYRERFWAKYPNKVGKPNALKKLDAARKRGDVTWAELDAGLDRYINKTDERHWCNPATWIFQQRWTDQPAQAPTVVHNLFAEAIR